MTSRTNRYDCYAMMEMNADPNHCAISICRQTSQRANSEGIDKFKHYWRKFHHTCIRRLSVYGVVKFILCRFQIIEIVMTYKKEYIFNDISAGIIASLLNLSQGLAYSALARLVPANGLYVSFFAPILYAIFGTSTQLSVGAFAIMTSLTGETLDKCVPFGARTNATEILMQRTHVAATLSFATGLTMIGFFFFKFGVCLAYLTDPLIGGYLCATAWQVVTNQIAVMLGIQASLPRPLFEIFIDWIYYFKNVGKTNKPTVAVFMCTAVLLASIRFLNTKFRKYLTVTIPFEVVVIILATVASWKLQLSEHYGITVIGAIPKGLPKPQLPHLEYLPCVGFSIITVTLVTMAVNLSLANKISMGSKRISANQELFAYGITNFITSFLQCFPACASLSATYVVMDYRVKTQVYGLVSSLVLAILLHVLVPYLQYLPKSVLAAFVVVNMSGLLARVVELWHYFKINLTEAFIWLQSFVCVFVFGIDTGLLVAIVISLITNVFLVQRPTFKILGKIPETNVYVDCKRFPEAITTPGIKIFIMEESLSSYNSKIFKRRILKTLHLFTEHKRPGINKLMSFVFHEKGAFDAEENDDDKRRKETKFLIVDCSAFFHIDSVGIRTLLNVNNIITANGIIMLLCDLRDQILRSLQSANFFDEFSEEHVFMLLDDAVHYATERVNLVL